MQNLKHPMKTTLTPTSTLIPIVFSLALVSGCATTSKITRTGPSTETGSGASVVSTVPASTRVWVLPPKVVYEDTVTEAILDSTTHGGPGLSAALTTKAIPILQAKNLPEVASVTDGNLAVEQKAAAEQASALANQLTRPNPEAEAIRCIGILAATNQSVAVLAQYVRVKVGPSGTWDPNSGAITSHASSSHFRAVLLDCQTGRRLWENSVLLRKVPDPNSGDFDKLVTLLYSTVNPQNKSKP